MTNHNLPRASVRASLPVGTSLQRLPGEQVEHPGLHRSGAVGALLLAVIALPVQAADTASYPERPIRMVIPFPPSGANDIVGRILGARLAESLGRQIVIDNRPGGGQVIGTDIVAKAAPNGYTLLLVSATHGINPGLYRKLPYDSEKDFSPITLVADSPLVYVVPSSSAITSIRDLVGAAKAQPGRINFASSGIGSGGHLAIELLKRMAGIDLMHVPYKGAAPALTDLLAGEAKLLCTSPLAVIPHIRGGRLRAIAVTSATRSQAAPDVPTIAESGFPGYAVTLWYALLAPAKTPASIIARLHAETVKAIRLPEVTERLLAQGVFAIGSTPEEFARFLNGDIEKWTKVIRAGDIRAD